MEKLLPVTYTHDISDIHSGGFSKGENPELALEVASLHELVTLHRDNFAKNLESYKTLYLEKSGEYVETKQNVFIHKNTHISDQVVYDSEKGIIVIEEGVKVMPFTYLAGPLRIDTNATINPHTNIAGSYIGKYCKIGGEVFDSVMEKYSNKAHFGCLESSFVGSWVNIGGGTSTSNLKNTYGNVKMNGIDTGEQLLGSIICDHVKTAVNTNIYTGKVIGVASHIYGTVTCDIPSFVSYINKNNIFVLPADIVIKTAERMAKRRNVEITEDMKKMLLSTYQATENDRQKVGVKNDKLTF
jgi:UDP-N-acetylglucosamine diphosphorylase/glucosamine-1-phosphate N-acetyltransferase